MSTRTPRRGPQSSLRNLTPRRTLLVLGIALFAWLLVPGLGPNLLGLPEPGRSEITGENTDFLTQLSELEVVEQVDAPAYKRAEFGNGWADLDGDGCNTRNEILARDLEDVTFREGTGNCVVETGVLYEPYTGDTVKFVRGPETSALVQIDHVVALGNAWYAGAWEWDATRRLEFANDPLNLLAVDGNANYEKSAHAADRWLPSHKDSRCEFAARQVAVKSRWELSVTSKEATTLAGILETCPQVTLSE